MGRFEAKPWLRRGEVIGRKDIDWQYAYTVIGLIEKQHRARNYLRWLRARGNVIREISGLAYQTIGKMRGFAAVR